MPQLNFVCLANSRKNSARCIAGKTIDTGDWVRPVGHFPTGELSEEDRRFENAAEPVLLDILKVQTLKPVEREDYQIENHLIDTEYYWVRQGTLPFAQLENLVDPVAPLWQNGLETRYGINNRVSPDSFGHYKYSLRLVKVDTITISVLAPSKDYGNLKRRVFGEFCSGGVTYRLDVTDPLVEAKYLSLPDGTHKIQKPCYVTVSLGEPNPRDGYAYKLIAAIIHGQ
mgnify:CR=1 FL=1